MTITVETWCEALESGKYKQGSGQLRDDDCFCCLGVLCDLSGAGKWDGDKYVVGSLVEDSIPQQSVCKLIGLWSNTGEFTFADLPDNLQMEIRDYYQDSYGELTDLNDHGVPFPLIAKVIRARPKGLFREDAQP
jgi:hypothetical protein